jgi:hypothetical protein
MALQVKGGMYCPRCNLPVAGQKSSHRIRNTASAVAAPATAGVSLAGVKVDDWHCPNCGGAVDSGPPAWATRLATPKESSPAAWVASLVFVVVLIVFYATSG